MDLSIIIPVYNVENKKLTRCFDSVNRIENIQFECLLIDDGSIPETGEFCKNYVQAHANFYYYRKDNGGVSSARNLGISLATGEYLCFVDADDEIVPEIYSCHKLFDNSYDLIFTDLREINGEHNILWKAFETAGEISFEMVVERIVQTGNLNGPVCKLFKYSFLSESSVSFREDMVQGEDAVFFCEILSKKPKMWYCDVVSYLYYHSYSHGNQRFIKEPIKCILNERQHSDKMICCIQMGRYSDCKMKGLLRSQKKEYIHRLFGRVLDSIEYGVISNEFQKVIKAEVDEINKKMPGEINAISRLEMTLLCISDWKKLKNLERIRSLYYRIKRLR